MAEELKSSTQIEQESFLPRAQKAKKQVKTFTDALATLASMGVGLPGARALKPYELGKMTGQASKFIRGLRQASNPKWSQVAARRLGQLIKANARFPQSEYSKLRSVGFGDPIVMDNALGSVSFPRTNNLPTEYLKMEFNPTGIATDSSYTPEQITAHEWLHGDHLSFNRGTPKLKARMNILYKLSQLTPKAKFPDPYVSDSDALELFAESMQDLKLTPGTAMYEMHFRSNAMRAGENAADTLLERFLDLAESSTTSNQKRIYEKLSEDVGRLSNALYDTLEPADEIADRSTYAQAEQKLLEAINKKP